MDLRKAYYLVGFLIVLAIVVFFGSLHVPTLSAKSTESLMGVHAIDTTNIRTIQWKHYYAVNSGEINVNKRSFYYARVKNMFIEAGFPTDEATVYAEIPSVESDWNCRAISKSGARGLWQFMPSTAKEYGLSAEELFDPALSTRIAINHIRDLDSLMNHDVAKVLFSYNAGLGLVNSQLSAYKTNNVWLVPFSSTETYHFAPKVLGAYLHMNN
jgi:soluble lytic murein transglycosylase-like protein